MRFAFVVTNLRGGGAEKALLKTASALAARGHAAHLVLLEDRADHAVPAGVRTHALLPVGTSASKGWLGKRRLARRLSRCIAALRPDLVISTLPFADEVAVLARLPRHWCRIANTLSAEIDALSRRSPCKAARRLRRYRRLYGQRPLIAVSLGVATDLCDRLRIESRIETIPNPFDAAAIRSAASLDAPGRPATPYVLHVGRFNPQKRHDLLLDAWKRVQSDRLLVLLAAPDPGLDALIAERGLAHRVLVAGFQPNPYPWMAGADLLVLCSDREGLPNVLIESLLCGTPVVSTDCPSGPREILGESLPGALVPCGDAAVLARAIEQSLAHAPDLSGVRLEGYGVEPAVAAYERIARGEGGPD